MSRFSLFILSIVILLGCSSSGPKPTEPSLPVNLFQPASPCAEEIEYRWEGVSGEQRSFYPGLGEFCTYLEGKTSSSLVEARCIVRDENNAVIPKSDWVSSNTAPLKELQLLCTGKPFLTQSERE